MSGNTGTNRSSTKVYNPQVFLCITDDPNFIINCKTPAMELLAESHWHCILQVSTSHLEHCAELVSLFVECSYEVFNSFKQYIASQQ
ncbi:hypothetical protein ExPECSC023_01458 [Escherichia coli]|nr:hypothetical protein ExPECSC023_01458 [Escherichia coli]GCO27883.1 hypothetical protein ExPECSC057_01865 [Escherichia coli]GCX62414.1 hypothetical protein HmCmsJML083_04653 [Escherichia coli]GDA51597.1 hypothetical protein HmCmsJML184_04850 [Escherichia coli]GDB46968.1 hypothetical protein HmCmsJML195_04434 [Escherichia coli]